MTFVDLAVSVFGHDQAPELSTEQLSKIAQAMEDAYCDGLRACAWRMGGIDCLFQGARSRNLDEVLVQVRECGGPLRRKA